MDWIFIYRQINCVNLSQAHTVRTINCDQSHKDMSGGSRMEWKQDGSFCLKTSRKNKVIEFLEDILKRCLLQLDYTSYTIITMIVWGTIIICTLSLCVSCDCALVFPLLTATWILISSYSGSYGFVEMARWRLGIR